MKKVNFGSALSHGKSGNFNFSSDDDDDRLTTKAATMQVNYSLLA